MNEMIREYNLSFSYSPRKNVAFENELRENISFDSGFGFGERDIDIYFETRELAEQFVSILNDLFEKYEINLTSKIYIEEVNY